MFSLNPHHELNILNGYSWPLFNTSLHVCHYAFIAFYPNVSMVAVVCILTSVFRFEEPLVMSTDRETRPRSYHQEVPLSTSSRTLSMSVSSLSLPHFLWLDAGRGLSMSLLWCPSSLLEVSSHHHHHCVWGAGGLRGRWVEGRPSTVIELKCVESLIKECVSGLEGNYISLWYNNSNTWDTSVA